MKINKKLLIIISAIILTVLYFTLGTSNEKITIKKPDKILPVKILVMDKDRTDESMNLDKANVGDISDIAYFAMSNVELHKKGDTYEGDLSSLNDLIFDDITDYVFAKNNDNGEVINDAKFLKKQKKVVIPVSYFENTKFEYPPVQFEIQTRITKKQLKNTNVKITVSSFGKKTKTVVLNNYDMQTDISIAGYGSAKSIPKSSIGVYLNNKSVKLSDSDYEWNPETGVVSLNALPITLNDVYITVNKKNIFSRFLNIKIANAVSYSKMKVYQTISGTPTNKFTGTFNKTLPISYVDTTTTNTDACDSFTSSYTLTSHWTKYQACKSGFNYMYGWGGSYQASYALDQNDTHAVASYGTVYTTFLVDLTNLSYEGLSFRSSELEDNEDLSTYGKGRPTWISLICYHAGQSWSSLGTVDNNGNGTVQISVLSKTSKYVVLGFRTAADNSQNGFGIYKFAYSSDNCTWVDMHKYFQNPDGSIFNGGAGLKFHVFDNIDQCNYAVNQAKLDEVINNTTADAYLGYTYTDETGQAYLAGIETDGADANGNKTLYIKEDFSNGGTDYNIDTTCHAVTINVNDRNYNCNADYFGVMHPINVIADTVFTNVPKKYCFSIAKKETGTNTTLNSNSFSFALADAYGNPISPSYTTTNGSVTFSDLTYQGYNVIETNGHGVKVDNKKYWNDHTSAFYIGPEQLTEMNSGAACNEIPVGDNPYYYCLRVKKVDANTNDFPRDANGNILEAKFKVGNEEKTTTNGIATFLLGSNQGTYTITETQAPEGYEIDESVKTVTIDDSNESKYLMAQGNYNIESNCQATIDEFTTFKDSSYVLNWYKVTENGSTRLPGAKFKVNDGAIKTKGMGTGKYSKCYKYSKTGDNDTFIADTNGEVCIIGLSKGTYKVTETKPGEYHTFGDVIEKNISTSTDFTTMNDSNKFINQPTYVKFTKKVSNSNYAGDGKDGEFTDITTAELQKIDFNVYDSAGNLLSFVYNSSEGVYEYAGNTIDLPSASSAVTDLRLDSNRNIILKHLAKGTYKIVEKETKTCGNTSSTNENCIGYYTPTNASTFTVTDNSTKNGEVYNTIVEMTNTPTDIEFTKKDFYGYEDASDVVDFENAEERNAFDNIVFKLKDENGNYLNLRYMGNSGSCELDSSYSIYRYVPSDNTNVSNDPNTGTELKTCGGHIHITNLCKGKRFIVEEMEVPSDSVFVLEKDKNGNNPSASYTIPCKEGQVTKESTTNIINDKPTRIRIEKRDLKYGNLINDESVTFEIYRCKKNETCNPSNYSTVKEREDAGMKLVKFSPRAYLTGDEEDGGADDFENAYEVYKAMSDSDVKNGQAYETSLHPDHGVLILRYLQSGYNYVALETKAPVGYNLPNGKLAETNFTVINTTVDVEAIKVANRPSKIIVRKYNSDGKLITGARFKIYKVNKEDYNENIAVSLQKKTELPLKTVRAGVYEYREVYDTNEFTTCSDTEISKCSSITETLTDDSFVTSDLKETIEVKEGEAIIQYLEVDNYYIIEEVKAPDGYELSKNEEDRYKIVYLPESVEKVDAFTELVNTETTFTFYKFDEYNNLLDGAEFKLQKLNQKKKYVDVTVTETTISDKKVYKVDSNSDNTVITTTNGSATVAYMDKGQYRIVETKAAPGKELPKKTLNVATFFVDDDGSVYGSAIITNKSKTEMIESKPKASAELVVNIQTGQTVIKYTLIIIVLLLIGAGLFIIKRKIDKK